MVFTLIITCIYHVGLFRSEILTCLYKNWSTIQELILSFLMKKDPNFLTNVKRYMFDHFFILMTLVSESAFAAKHTITTNEKNYLVFFLSRLHLLVYYLHVHIYMYIYLVGPCLYWCLMLKRRSIVTLSFFYYLCILWGWLYQCC